MFGRVKKIDLNLFKPLKKPKIFFWAFLLLAILCVLAGIFAPAKLGAWIFASFSLFCCLFVKLFFLNHIKHISDEECIHFFGKQGSGKSFFMAREASIIKNRSGRKIIVNRTFSHFALADQVCVRSDLGHKDLGEGTLLLWDEGNLDGFDNRNTTLNFKDNCTLEFFLKHRQNSNPIMITSQGFKSLDKKIREDVCTGYYFCRNFGFFCVAQKLSLDMQLDPITSEPIEFFSGASIFSAITTSDSWLFGIPLFQARKLYRTKVRSVFDKGSFF